MRKHLIIIIAFAVFLGSCRSQAPVIEATERQTPSSPTLTETVRTKVEGFEFEVVASSMTRRNRIIVEVLITNTFSRDTEIVIRADSRIFDNLGNEYRSSKRSIGLKGAGRHIHLTHLFVSNTPTRLTIEFPNTDPEAKSIYLMELAIDGLKSNAQFRNFNLRK